MTADELAAPVEGMPEEPLYYDDHGEPATGRGSSQPSMVGKSAYDDLRAYAGRLQADNALLKAAVRDAAAHWDKYLVDDYYLARWLRNHAAAIAMAGKP